jgi:hypothetical protein
MELKRYAAGKSILQAGKLVTLLRHAVHIYIPYRLFLALVLRYLNGGRCWDTIAFSWAVPYLYMWTMLVHTGEELDWISALGSEIYHSSHG